MYSNITNKYFLNAYLKLCNDSRSRIIKHWAFKHDVIIYNVADLTLDLISKTDHMYLNISTIPNVYSISTILIF